MQSTKENKMGTMPMGPLMMGVSVPIVISMLVQACYNVVDSIFVGMVSDTSLELTAVGLAFPIQNLMIAVAVGTAVGVNSLLARRLGEKNYASANRTASNGVFLAVLSWLVFLAFGLFFTEIYFNMSVPLPTDAGAIAAMGQEYANNLLVRSMGISYTRIVAIGSLAIFVAVVYERLLQATGRSMFSMVSQLSGALTNIVLDPIMIFGLLGFPKMGVAGAALATVIGQFVGMFVGMAFNHFKNPEIQLSLRGFRPNPKTIKHIYQVGVPSIVMQAIGSVMVLGMNRILIAFSTAAVAVFGVYFKLQSFVFMPVLGFNNGMISIVGYNFGARKPQRIRQAVTLAAKVCFGIMAVGTLLFWIMPDFLLGLFSPDAEMLVVGRQALRVISLSFPMAAVSIVFSGTFQALGQGLYSLVMSVVRQLVFLLPLAWVLARFNGLHSVWFSFLVAEVFSLTLGILFFRHTWRNKIKPLGALPDPVETEETKEEQLAEQPL